MKQMILLFVALLSMVTVTQAQALKETKPFGSKGLYEITPVSDTVSVIPVYSASVFTMDVDTNIVLQVDTVSSSPASLLWFEVTADGTQRTVTFDIGLEAASSTVAANKSRTWGFVYIGNRYVLIHESAEY
ncbi:hypothetical protein [uncultured Draconibacterium sp.]|uniref:hypothetical protein n=1 Tax=uncultured Draconibacterium sp. TaxID=1573823 RepID=UPI0025D47C36|nr:hypothetical protein [uncultured Draconibacterium sp.]